MNAPSLYSRHEQIALGIANQYGIPGADRDDVRQEARIGLWIAARTHTPQRGPFPPFARLVIHRRLATILKAALRQKQMLLTNAARDIELVGGPEPDRVVITADTLRSLVTAINTLNPTERQAVQRMIDGQPIRRTDKRLDNAAHAARRKLKAAVP